MSFANLKNKRRSIEEVKAAADKAAGDRKSYDDERFWSPTVDKQGNASALIRFLPAKDGEELPWIQYWSHAFKGPTGKWYIEKSLTTLGKEDPVSESNSKLWNTGVESDKALARKRKRKLNYVSNILVINDPEKPENNGKVFLYRYGKKIFEKAKDMMSPDPIENRPAIDPFDFWGGCDFRLRQQKVDGFPNYDKSTFAEPSTLKDDDSELEAIYNQMYNLEELIAPKEFKEYADLKRKFLQVIGESGFDEGDEPATASSRMESAPSVIDTDDEPEVKIDLGDDPAPSASQTVGSSGADDDEDEDLKAFFSKLTAD